MPSSASGPVIISAAGAVIGRDLPARELSSRGAPDVQVLQPSTRHLYRQPAHRRRRRPRQAANRPRTRDTQRMDSLFDEATADDLATGEPGAPGGGDTRPLAARVRPRTLREFVGQAHLLRAGSALRTAIEQGHPHSMVLYGPPGSGKTTLARMVAARSSAAFEELSAVQAGRAEVRAVIERAAHRRDTSGGQTVLFLDEIHRFNKAQQDALLPAVEEVLLTLIGATTENPAFEVNGALLSRLRVYALQALTAEELATVLRRAAGTSMAVQPDAFDFLAARSEGDARTALNALELAAATAAELGEERVTLQRVEDALQRRAILYD